MEERQIIRQVRFGRSTANNVVVQMDEVSAEHAVIIQLDNGTFFIRDLQSTNGTFVNGQRVEECSIKQGDAVLLANVSIDWFSYFDTEENNRDKAFESWATLVAVGVLALLLIVGSVIFLGFPGSLFPGDDSGDTAFSNTTSPASFSDLVARTERAVFLIETQNNLGELAGTGTGFFVSRDGLAVSNHHVFEPGISWNVRLQNHRVYPVEEVIYRSKHFDFVIFRVRKPEKHDFPYLPLASRMPRKGDDVFVVGNPKGIEQTLTKGVVSGLRSIETNTETFTPGDTHIQFDAAISTGSSGSPVLNMNGEVIGVATLKIEECESCNFAINIRLVQEQLNELSGWK